VPYYASADDPKRDIAYNEYPGGDLVAVDHYKLEGGEGPVCNRISGVRTLWIAALKLGRINPILPF
jgi:hypothetical protein